MRLEALHRLAAERWGESLAVVAADGRHTYLDIDRGANRLARRLRRLGAREGHRVGVWLPKGGRAIIAFQAVLRLGAAYVPLDPTSPAERVAGILSACEIRCVVTTAGLGSSLPTATRAEIVEFSVDGPRGWTSLEEEDPDPLPPVTGGEDVLAYILYTSGSTGSPKGVCLSHRNALAFIRWAGPHVEAGPEDRFSSHAPFHFDLSVFDIYVPALVGASLHVLAERASFAPKRLVRHLVEQQITVWYSVPSALVLMLDHGELERAEVPPRVVIFAGEPFPMEALRRLRALWPLSRFFNFYGPTETNVCAAYEVDRIAAGATSIPIGGPAAANQLWAETSAGVRAESGEEGELWVRGPTVMMGYWGEPPVSGIYRTGDVVRVLDNHEYTYIGRRDGMVKRRGYRIELGEIESAIAGHPDVGQAAAVVSKGGLETQIAVFLIGTSGSRPSNLKLRSYVSKHLPGYMFPDRMLWVDALPLNGNGKVDRKALLRRAREEERTT